MERTFSFGQFSIVLPKNLTIGKGCIIINGVVMMGVGRITIGDKALVGAHAKLISNNYDPYERAVLLVKPVVIKGGAWIGAGVTVLPGITIGKYSIFEDDSVVTKDISDNAIIVGALAKVIKFLDPVKFK